MKDLRSELYDFLQEYNYVSPWIVSFQEHNAVLAQAGSIATIKKKHTLFLQGECNPYIYIVRTGRFRVFYTDQTGTEKCIYILEKGGMMGETSAFDGSPNYISAYAITDATLFKIHIQDFQRIIQHHPQISLEVIQSLNYKLRLLCSQMEYSTKNARVRVAAALIALCARYGQQQTDGSIRIPIRFTHEELSNLVNLNRVTVSKVYREFLQERVIANPGNYIIVHHIESLQTCLQKMREL